MSETFTCEQCGGVFEKQWSDEEAMAEATSLWGVIPESERAICCDDCFNAMMPHVPAWARQDLVDGESPGESRTSAHEGPPVPS